MSLHQPRPRRSLWNLAIIPFAVSGMVFTVWALSIPLDYLARIGMPRDSFLDGSTGFGWFLHYFSLGLISIAPGLIFGNCMVWFLPFLRLRLNAEALRNRTGSFGTSNAILFKMALSFFIFLYPLAALGDLRHFSVATDGIYNRGWFSYHIHQYKWQEVKKVRTECEMRRNKSSWQNEARFIVVEQDGTEIDLVANWYKDFFKLYPKIAALLKNIPYEFQYIPPEQSPYTRPCPKEWASYFMVSPAK